MLKQVYDWLQVFLCSVLIFITIPYTPLIWKTLSAAQKSQVIIGIYFLALLLGISILIYLLFLKKERSIFPYFWFLIAVLLYVQSFSILNEFPVEKVHLIEYGILGFLVFKALKNNLKNLNVYIWSLLLIFYVGIFDETIQWLIPNRIGDIIDVWLNTKSGVLSLLLIGLVIRPRDIEYKVSLTNLEKIYIPISLAIAATGVFINLVHDFGYKIRVSNDIGMYSHFTEKELRLIDSHLKKDIALLNRTASKFEKLVIRKPNAPLRESKEVIFFKESADHRWERDNLFLKKKFLQSLKEQIILNSYYSSVLNLNTHKWDINKEMLAEELSKKNIDEDFYSSPVCSILITKFSKAEMWIFIGVMVIVLMSLYVKSNYRNN